MDPRLAPLRDLVAAYGRHPVRRVAVVGNAPMDPSRSRAEAIDTADVVIRVNSFVVDVPGSPPTQGSRTDVVLFSRLVPVTPSFFSDYSTRLYVLLEPMRMFGRKEVWPASWPRDLGFAVARNDAVAVPLNEELGTPWRRERLAPTTGTTGVWLALRLFPEATVTAAGISFIDDAEQTEWRHQWGDSVGVGPEHRITAESRLMRQWLTAGRITVLPLTGGD